ncbi:hypothetical protein GW17_00028102 [Ensete ventricosum]|nr:hypothetical protein GW17_00028102 [Ensete ventricosum]
MRPSSFRLSRPLRHGIHRADLFLYRTPQGGAPLVRRHQTKGSVRRVFVIAGVALEADRLHRPSLPPLRHLRPSRRCALFPILSPKTANLLLLLFHRRFLLRSGPAGSLRVNIRAVAQYAAEDGNGKAASDAVEQCLRLPSRWLFLSLILFNFRGLEDLDSLLVQAIRNNPTASVESMKSKLDIVLGALDSLKKRLISSCSLLQTVPSKVLDKGKAIADAYRIPSYQNDEGPPEDLDPEVKNLEALL